MSVNILLSYAFHAKENIGKVRSELVCGKLMIDSGAFTAHSIGQRIDRVEYAEFLETWHGAWDHAVTLDVIGEPAATKVNTKWLHAKGLNVMPVFTRQESLSEFDAMVRDCGYVCVGGGVGMSKATVLRRIALLQRRAADLGGGVHALGMGAIDHVRQSRPYSADSSNISTTFRYGNIRFFDGRQVRTITVSDKEAIRKYWIALRGHDIDVAQLASTGRMPTAQMRHTLMRSMSLAYACADEWLRQTGSAAPVPHGVPDSRTGPHLYSSIVGSHLLPGAIELDRELHNGYKPPVWAGYGWSHECRKSDEH